MLAQNISSCSCTSPERQTHKQSHNHGQFVSIHRWPSCGRGLAEATETLIYSSWTFPLPSLNPSLRRDFSLARYWVKKATNHYVWLWLPTRATSIILSKFVFILSFHIKNILVHCLLTPLPPIHLIEYGSSAAATSHNTRQNTSVWCLLMSPLQRQPSYHHKMPQSPALFTSSAKLRAG